jgi:hypothetical protein
MGWSHHIYGLVCCGAADVPQLHILTTDFLFRGLISTRRKLLHLPVDVLVKTPLSLSQQASRA